MEQKWEANWQENFKRMSDPIKKEIEELNQLIVSESNQRSQPFENDKIQKAYAKIRKLKEKLENLEKVKHDAEEKRKNPTPSFWSRFFGGKSRKRRRTGKRKLRKKTRK